MQILHSPGVPVGIEGSVTAGPGDSDSSCRSEVLGPGLAGAGGSCLRISSRMVALTVSSRDASALAPVDGPPAVVVEPLTPAAEVPAVAGVNAGAPELAGG